MNITDNAIITKNAKVLAYVNIINNPIFAKSAVLVKNVKVVACVKITDNTIFAKNTKVLAYVNITENVTLVLHVVTTHYYSVPSQHVITKQK